MHHYSGMYGILHHNVVIPARCVEQQWRHHSSYKQVLSCLLTNCNVVLSTQGDLWGRTPHVLTIHCPLCVSIL
jgi:hypothetical protein